MLEGQVRVDGGVTRPPFMALLLAKTRQLGTIS